MARRTASSGLACAVLAVLASASRAALAQQDAWKPTARLEVDGATAGGGQAACPDVRALADAVTGRLGYDPFVASGGDLRISVHFARNAAGVSGLVEAFDPSGAPKGEKTVASKRGDCAEVAQAVTLTIAILLDPRSGLVAPPAFSKAEPDPLAPVTAEASTASTESTAPRVPAPPSIVPRVRAGLLGTIGAEPGPSVALRAGIGLGARIWSIDAELRADLPRDSAGGGKTASSALLLGALVPCLRRSAFEACGVLALGALRSDVPSGTPPSAASFHAAAGPRLGVVLPLGEGQTFAFRLDAEALFTLTKTDVRIDGMEVWSAPLVSAGIGAALEVRFP